MIPDPETHVTLEQLAHGQWHCLCPDGVPRGVTNYVEAMAGALLWATNGGFGLVTSNHDGVTDLVLKPQPLRRRGGPA